MPNKKTNFIRLNIYINDPDIRRQVKRVAANQDISVSEYCVRAITRQLIKDGERSSEGKLNSLKSAVKKAHRFQAETFGERVFSVSSADLIRKARENRNKL